MDFVKIRENFAEDVEDFSTFQNEGWNLEAYNKRIIVHIVSVSNDKMELQFDLLNVEAPIANAIRRILIAEVPTVAIEKIYLYQNTSCIQDEVLCHRLGLLPVRVDPSLFIFPDSDKLSEKTQGTDDYVEEEPSGNPKQNLILRLHTICPTDSKSQSEQKKGKVRATKSSSKDTSIVKDGTTGNWTLYSCAFKWIPIADQGRSQSFNSNPPSIVNDDIIIAKLRPGQEIEASCHCVKGIGRDHAKFSPVATASYRLHPEIKLSDRISGERAVKLKSCFSEGVIGIDANGFAFVKDSRNDSSSRNVHRYDDLKNCIELSMRKNHFIFTIESTGILESRKLMSQACQIMKMKARILSDSLRLQISSQK